MVLATIGIIVGVLAVITIWCMIAWYRVVPPTEAHVVASGSAKWVVSADDTLATTNKRSYFEIPLLRKVRALDLTIKELDTTFETVEKKQARYRVRASLKYKINNPLRAAETYTTEDELHKLLEPVVQAGVRAVTVTYDVVDARADKLKIEQEVTSKVNKDLEAWGHTLVNFQLVDFQDTPESKIISNISKQREVEIESNTRQVNAERLKEASVIEANNKQMSETRRIEMEEAVSKREQDKFMNIAEREKIAQESHFRVVEVQNVQLAEIAKKKAIIEAEQRKRQAIIAAEQAKESEEINKDRKELEGQGNRLKAEEDAKALAAPIKAELIARADGNKALLLAEAEGKLELQKALSKFDDSAIRALIAEKIVSMQQIVGIANAEALKEAKINAFMGSGDKGAFDFGQLMTSLGTANAESASAVLNRLAKPNDLGIGSLSIGGVAK